jgi:hypothetical protein
MFDEAFLENSKVFDLLFVGIFIVCELSGGTADKLE